MLELLDGYAVARITGEMTLPEAAQKVNDAILMARQQNIRNLMTVVVEVSGFDVPSAGDRYHMSDLWAKSAAGYVRLAMVTRPEFIHPQKLGVLVARNRGLMSDIFSREEEAVAWLLALE